MSKQTVIPQQEVRPELTASTIARALAPEDISVGDFVAVLYSSREFPKTKWDSTPSGETVRVTYIPGDGGLPQKVQAICLPFVLVQDPTGSLKSIDVRVSQIARLELVYAKTAWKAHKARFKRMSRKL